MFKNILLGAGVFAGLFTVLIFSGRLPIGQGESVPKGEVVIWGTISSDFMEPLIQQYNIKAKTYRVSYKEVNENRFVSTLVDALANGAGPDMILAPYQIIISQSSRLYPYPLTSITEKTYKDAYVDGASVFWSPYGALALPVSIEPMVLFYNRTLLSKHGIANPPTHWDEFIDITPKLTVINNKSFTESAIALGSYSNVPYTKDILITIVNQLGQAAVLQLYGSNGLTYDVLVNKPVMGKEEVYPLTTAVRFITQFTDQSKETYTWSQFLSSAPELFIAEKLAMYIGYSGEFSGLQSSNQKLDFGMTYLPQIKDANTFTTGMRMYGLATLRQTRNPQAALVTESTLSGVQWSSSIASAVGGISPLKSVISQSGLPEVISRSALIARGWPDIYYNQSSELFARMMDEILSGRSLLTDAVERFEARFESLYYKI